jgi:hypothetical protein
MEVGGHGAVKRLVVRPIFEAAIVVVVFELRRVGEGAEGFEWARGILEIG